ncbi:MAG: hypothetical protein ACRDZN_05630, partial [Acidimicrobiales bacterium]
MDRFHVSLKERKWLLPTCQWKRFHKRMTVLLPSTSTTSAEQWAMMRRRHFRPGGWGSVTTTDDPRRALLGTALDPGIDGAVGA